MQRKEQNTLEQLKNWTQKAYTMMKRLKIIHQKEKHFTINY